MLESGNKDITLTDSEKGERNHWSILEAASKGSTLSAVQHVTTRYVNQLLHGCGTLSCRNEFCDTGRRNCSVRPIRKYTPRAARAIAITLASGAKPRSRFCTAYVCGSTVVPSEVTQVGERDPSAFQQQLADTRSIQSICKNFEDPTKDELHRLHDCLRVYGSNLNAEIRNWHARLDLVFSNRNFPPTSDAGGASHDKEAISECLLWLLKQLPSGKMSQWRYVIDIIGSGSVYPSENQDVPCDPTYNNWLSLLDAIEYGPSFRLFLRLLKLLASWHTWHQKYPPTGESPSPLNSKSLENSQEEGLLGWVMDALPVDEAALEKHLALVAWLKKAFLRYWDGNPLLPFDSIPYISLSTLKQMLIRENDSEILRHAMPINTVARRMNIMDIAKSWLDGPREQHLLSFSFIFHMRQQATYLRGINFERMAEATLNTRKVSELRSRHPRSSGSYFSHAARLKYLEENYLLLNVSRGDILKDTFDQLWQRRESELFRPLRVRLGEMDTFEVGHDLGGVQIEFFNLLCRKLFDESAQIFTTESTTGYSYFRAASLQPLHMFELCGLAFALALYNGISLPVNLPQAFYLILTEQQCTSTSCIDDAWPVIRKSLDNILDEDVPGLERTFPLEANGLRLTFLDHPKGSLGMSSETPLYVIHATPIVHHEDRRGSRRTPNSLAIDGSGRSFPGIIEDIHEAWPNWDLNASTLRPIEITPENKHFYVTSYVEWLTYKSVEPQWTAFLKGFRRLFPPSHLRMLSCWTHLRSILEGTPNFNIDDLRKVTQYESGFDGGSKYIQNFWKLVTAWPMEKQRALLKFVTACERVPAGGAGCLTFRIKRAPDADALEGRLPTSSTCFGTLILPMYESMEVLERKLSLALKYGVEGFGSA